MSVEHLILGTGANHSEREYRDINMSDLSFTFAPPVKFDAGYSNIPVEMQNKNGICTAEAAGTLIERYRNDGKRVSRKFLYMAGKKFIDGNITEGSSIKTMLQAAYKYGIMFEDEVPTDTTVPYEEFINFDPTPFLSIASARKIPGYISIPVNPSSLINGIYSYNGIAVRFDVGQEWWTDVNGNVTWEASKILPLRKPQNIVSGHAVVFDGYDFTNGFKTNIRNSWSTNWALNGDGYTYFEKYSPTEAWAISEIPLNTINTVNNLPNPKTWKHTFATDLTYGDSNDEVKNLQTALVIDGDYTYKDITNNYRGNTQAAVLAFQKKYNLTNWFQNNVSNRGTYVGPITRAKLNQLFG